MVDSYKIVTTILHILECIVSQFGNIIHTFANSDIYAQIMNNANYKTHFQN